MKTSGSPAWIRTTIHSFQSRDHPPQKRQRSWTAALFAEVCAKETSSNRASPALRPLDEDSPFCATTEV